MAETPQEQRLSRFLALILRHLPEQFGLTLDEHGYAPIDGVARACRERYPDATVEWLRRFVAGPGARRFVIEGDRMAARYGHSVAVDPEGAPCEPPEELYHGTQQVHVRAILAGGILPVRRRYVHLSSSLDDAREVAARQMGEPVVLRVFARRAHEKGVLFFRAGHLYVCGKIAPEFIDKAPAGDSQGAPPPRR